METLPFRWHWLALLFWLPLGGYAQPVPLSAGLQLGIDGYYGKLLKHSPDMKFDLPEPVRGLSLELMKQTYGKDYWSAVYRYPRYGFVLHMHRFGNPQVLGTAWAGYPQLDIFLWRSPQFCVFLRMGFGLAYVDRPFDREDNPTNTAIGSYMNNLTTVGLGLEYRPFRPLMLRLGGNVTHVSNGRTTLPNLGINTFALRMGLSYELANAPDPLPFSKEDNPVCKKWLPHLRLGTGLTETKVPNGPKYHVLILQGYAGHMLSRKSKLQLGMEVSYTFANQSWLKNQDITENDNPEFRTWRVAALAGHELMLGQFSFVSQVLIYADPPFGSSKFLAVKLGPNAYLFRPQRCNRFNLFCGIYMKSHFQVAELVEITLGASF